MRDLDREANTLDEEGNKIEGEVKTEESEGWVAMPKWYIWTSLNAMSVSGKKKECAVKIGSVKISNTFSTVARVL